MCAQYLTEAERKRWEQVYGIKVPDEYKEFRERILPYKFAPVIKASSKGNKLEMMNFSLIPVWSKEPRVRFATHNARLESEDDKTGETKWIYEKATWKRPFLSRHCLVPISAFYEPIYRGEYAGNMVEFHDKEKSQLTAAAIWDSWTDKKSGEVIESFSIITDDPPNFIKEIGHDRCPLFLKEKAFDEWLNDTEKDPEDMVKFLRKNRETFDWVVEKDRPMKPGWEKRIPRP